YNAGSHRAREWISDWGDPRSPSVDVVDWIELIPFSETRNYVQRVTENLQVYRYRLAGGPVQIELERDLHRGRP
ncbi:MAG: lytic transglycosylase domain-containing protein, partial [Hyphomonadaceae bacterium]|nr:lytic transglycosylase domain-containing protein [Hyphomonadaceae bacterium]